MATAVRFSLKTPAKIHAPTMSAKVTAVTHSSRDSGPISRRAWRAAAGASGVSVTPGGNTQKIRRGSRAITVTSAGTEATNSHVPKSTFNPCSSRQRDADRIGRCGGEPQR
jgi:hypothetical protein